MEIKLPVKLDTRRSHRILQFFLERAKGWQPEGRELTVYWSTAHMLTVAQLMRLLALRRGLEPDIAAVAGALHDVYSMETGLHEDHAAKAKPLIDELLKEYNAQTPDFTITDSEIVFLKEIIAQHSDKQVISDNPYAELLKDADAIDRYLQGVPTKDKEKPRIIKALNDIGLRAEFT